MQVQKMNPVPMAMQIWKHRRSGGEVKIVWANSGKVAWIGSGCMNCGCPKDDRCDPNVYDQADFTDQFAYARAF